MSTRSQVLIAIAAAVFALASPLGVAGILLLAGGVGLWLFHSRKLGAAVLASIAACLAVVHILARSASVPGVVATPGDPPAASLVQIGAFLLKVGALTFGGGLTMIAFMQEQVVSQFHWLTPQEFLDGLALGQFTPGPILMVAAYVGYKVAGVPGALIGGGAAFLPSFALPDLFAIATLVATVVVLMVWRVATLKIMLLGAVLGIARSRLFSLPGAKAVLSTVTRG